MRAKSQNSALRWLSFFRKIQGVNYDRVIRLRVPDMAVTLDIHIPWRAIQKLVTDLSRHAESKKKVVRYDRLASVSWPLSPLLQYIMKSALTALGKVDYLSAALQQWLRYDKVGLAWRRYDRLEWIPENSEESIYCSWVMRKTHDLELRPKRAYEMSVRFGSGSMLTEPIPIEGFLIRLTTWLGEAKKRPLMRKLFFRRLYFHTHDNLLFYSKPVKATPPHPVLGALKSGNENLDSVISNMPKIVEIAPFRTIEGNIEWINEDINEEKLLRRDKAALDEMLRRVSLVIKADGFVDLTEVEVVRPVKRGEGDENLGNHNGVDFDSIGRDDGEEDGFHESSGVDGEAHGFDDENVFEIVSSNGFVIRLQAFDRSTRDTWISRLTDLSIYWKARLKMDVERLSNIRHQNLNTLRVDEDTEAFIGEASPKWETSRAVVDPYIYNISRVSLSRTIIMQGLLFQKPSRLASFRRFHVVLTHGSIILYTLFARGATGTPLPKANHNKYQVVSLHDCYIFSGPITSMDLLQRDRWFDSSNPGTHSLPRAYPDGWKSVEEESLRCFALWFGHKKPLQDTKSKKLRVVNRLGASGDVMVFVTRSRQERDLWVTALNQEIDRLVESDYQEIKLED